jgi:predicted DNA-binding transcriptional regulator AlpA
MKALTLKQISNEFSISRTSLWRYRKYKSFPKPLPGCGNDRVWLTQDVKDWLTKFTL